jgi:hypothetical protein
MEMTHENRGVKNIQGRSGHARHHIALGLIVSAVLVMPIISFLIPNVYAQSGSNLDDAEFMLSITPAAPSLPSDGQSYYMVVQLMTINANPIEAPNDIEVRIVSSDPSVITIPTGTFVLKKGESMGKVNIATTSKPGIASVTASTSGVQSATVNINTVSLDSLDPTMLAVYAAPSFIIPDPKYDSFAYVQLLNSQGLPSVSKKTISVSLSSSDSTIATVPSSVTISPGRSGVLVNLTPGQNVGQTTLTASAASLSPGTAQVSTGGPVATRLLVEFGPTIIAAEPYANTLMSVQLQDQAQLPVKAASTITVELRSSDTRVLDPPISIQIPAGKSYVTTTVESGDGFEGEATITATAPGLQAGFATISAVERSDEPLSSTDKTLGVYLVPSILSPDNSGHQTVVVAFFDNQGRPVEQSSHLYQRIVLSSSNGNVGTLSDDALVTRTMYAIGKFNTGSVTGETTITASLTGYASAQSDLRIDGSAPTAIVLTQIPGVVQAADESSNSLVVSLVDEDGSPVSVTRETSIFLTSSDPEIATVDGLVTIAAGESIVVASVHTTLKEGQTTITGSSVGLDSGSVEFTTAGFTGSISAYTLGLYALERIPADGRTYEAIVVQLQDQNGNPVYAIADVPVSLSSSSFVGGTVQSSVTIPKGSNYATATFTPSTQKTNGIAITASSEGFQSVGTELSTTAQGLVVLRTGEIPKTVGFGTSIPINVDVFSARDLPIEGATVSVVFSGTTVAVGSTDGSGHLEAEYISPVPGQGKMALIVSKAGYEDETVSLSFSVTKEIAITIKAVTEQNQKPVAAPIGVQGPSKPSAKASPIMLTDAKFGAYTLTPKDEIKTAEAIYKFVGWSDGSTANPRSFSIVDDTVITAVYSAQFMLKIDNELGTTSGGGYYHEGAKASLAISPTSIGGILVDKNFAGWSGDITVASATADITMNSPKTVKAVWTDSYWKLFIIVGAAGGGGAAYYIKVFKPKREAMVRDKAPDLDWFKS